MNLSERSSYRLKRPLDLLILTTAHVVLFPIFFALWAVIPLLVLILDGRPVFYGQPRVGKGGRHFMAYKFRTMRIARPGEVWENWTSNEDPRVSRLGKLLRSTALDELPQILNIARGDISFVGPRPLVPEQVEEYSVAQPRFPERHRVPPGLTGLSQVYLPRHCPPSIRLRYDLHYAKKASLMLDIKLIFLSGFLTLTGKWGAGRRQGMAILRDDEN
ncbi:MAG: sugar transferase [Chloroflexi bacterium]|nr:sugar transferase [Chloroflexota bacterium]